MIPVRIQYSETAAIIVSDYLSFKEETLRMTSF